MAGFVTRDYRPSDRKACRGLWVELVQRHRDIYGDPSIGGDNPGACFDRHLVRVGPDNICVAESGGEVVGFAGLIVHEEQAEVEPIVVSPHHRGRGVGHGLLDWAVAQARRKGMLRMSVQPVARNEQAISFFHGFGFRGLGQVELVMDLCEPPSVDWQPGHQLFGREFHH